MVTPPILALPEIEVAPGGRAGDGRPRPYTLERTLTSATIREYAAGDPLNWVHWPSTARHGDLAVRLFDGAPVGDWWIVLDVAAVVQAGEGMASTEEHGIVLAASLADRGLRMGRNVGFVAHGSEPTWLMPRHDADQRLRILRALALLGPGALPLAGLLERSRGALGRHASVILITPDVRGEWLPGLLAMRRRGIVPTVLLLDPHTFGEPRRATGTSTQLSSLGIAHHVIPRELLDRPGLVPGEQGRWEWKVGGMGRAVAVHKPAEMPWKELG
jgi:uncharacterized protein (DUF58 family)